MIARDASPIGHTPPLPRIDLNARPGGEPDRRPVIIPTARIAENARIWQLVVEASGGTAG